MSLNQLTQRLHAITAIPVTPFTADRQVDWEAFYRLVARLVEDGMEVISPNGNTGEFYALARDEQRRAVEVAAQAAGGRALLLPGVAYDVATAVEMGRFASRR